MYTKLHKNCIKKCVKNLNVCKKSKNLENFFFLFNKISQFLFDTNVQFYDLYRGTLNGVERNCRKRDKQYRPHASRCLNVIIGTSV